MKVDQLYTGCLAEAAYYIESDGEAVIIDPLREYQPYLDRAAADGAKIKYVLETHFHADFVSGHLDLAKKTGAKIVYGPTAKPNFDAYVARDGEELRLGKVTIKVLHTPGHTMESATYLLRDENGKDYAIFTGDTLFIGDVGRPDLAVKSDLTREDLAGYLFDSLRTKIMPLADDVIVYPGHGAGSACGKKLSNETQARLGDQKMFNYALRADMAREEFIREVTEGLVEPPQYFPKDAVLNRMGYESFDEVLKRGMRALSVDEFVTVAEATDALILDTRKKDDFVSGFIPGSMYIGIDGDFAPWVGVLIQDLRQPILFVSDPGEEEAVVTRLARVGYDNALGYLKGGIQAWKAAGKDVEIIEEITAVELEKSFTKDMHILDLRKESEYNSEHLVGVANFPLDFIYRNLAQLEKGRKYYLHCASGYRSVIAASILQARGYKVVNVPGGMKALRETKLSRTEYVEPSTML